MTRRSFVAYIAASLLPAVALAQPVSGPYVSLGAGVGLQQSLLREPSERLLYPNWWRFDPGFSSEVSFGWGFDNGFRVEVEAPYLSNHVSGVGGYAGPRRAGGTEQKYGGMVNALYDFNTGLPVTPYLGIGAGGLEITHNGFNSSPPGFIFPHPPGDETRSGFAYQGIAGLSYNISFVPGLAMTVEYRFLGILDPQQAYRTNDFNSAGTVIATNNARYANDFNHSILLGFRYAFGAPPPPPPPEPVIAPPPAVPAPPAAQTYLVFFDWDRADLTARAREIVAQAAQASSHVQTTTIEVNGYTDLSGTAAYNQRLSVRRAQSVEAELVRDGVAENEISIHGYGESNPLVPTGKGVREPQNRRVEIILH
jgi:OmpA-OmpF porin, OOP family